MKKAMCAICDRLEATTHVNCGPGEENTPMCGMCARHHGVLRDIGASISASGSFKLGQEDSDKLMGMIEEMRLHQC